MEGDAAGMVRRNAGIQDGLAGAVARAIGTQPLGPAAAAGQRGAWRGDHCPGTGAAGLEGGRVEPAGQNRSGQGGVGRPVAAGDDDDHGADSAEAAHGNPKHLERETSREERCE